MSQYSRTNFKGRYGVNTAGAPFEETFAATIGGLTWQEFANSIGDSLVFNDQVFQSDILYTESFDWIYLGSSIPAGWNIATSDGTVAYGASAYGLDSTEKAIGVSYGDTGTTGANGYSTYYKGAIPQSFLFGLGHQFSYRSRNALSALSTGAQRYTAYVGFGDEYASASEHANGVYFKYNDSISANWQCVTAKAGVRTTTDSGIPAAITFQMLEIRVNSAGTSVDFYIDGVKVVTTTTNIPTTVAFGLVRKIVKAVGVTPRSLYEDCYDFSISVPTGR
jgi:hypothetical protein